MDMEKYLKNAKGIGILSTADGVGKVNAAVYGRPHFMADGTVAFIMLNRLTHHNLQSNSFASYLFIEKDENYKGFRLHLSKNREEQDTERLYKLRRVKYSGDENKVRYLVFFRVDKIMPLQGASESDLPFEL